jgi:SAM-dependent methyltransferase
MNLRPIHMVASDQTSNEFEQLYVNLRQQENRIYNDEEVAWLPDIAEDHIHKKEWEIRKASCKNLLNYLRDKKKSLNILEVGCGNGWLSYQFSQVPYSHVVGLDVNLLELQQAERVFAAIPNLNFVYGDIHSSLPIEKFDVIVFAASIQYFKSFPDIINATLNLLADKGEIHIIDSHFYSEEQIIEARQRTHQYFHSKGFDKMDEFYFHHCLNDLKEFKYSFFYDPNSSLNKLLRKKNPFHWICIKK